MDTKKFIFSIDSLLSRGDRIFGWGWLFSATEVVSRVDLIALYEDGSSAQIPLSYGATRADVAQAFPEHAQAACSGFLIVSRLRKDVALTGGCLRVLLGDGSIESLELPGFPSAYMTKSGSRAHWANRGRKALAEWRHAHFEQSYAFLKRSFRGLFCFLRQRYIYRSIEQARGWHVVFDHALGGGANRYRQRYVEELVATGAPVAVVTPQLGTLTYHLNQCGKFGRDLRNYNCESDVLAALSIRQIACITINNLVSYDDPEAVISWILQCQSHGAQIKVMLHDFFFVCPSFTLLDRHHRYCGVPALAQCKECLENNDTVFLSFIRHRDQQRWRATWWGLLSKADEIIAFSESTLRIARRAYPLLDQCAIKVTPHIVDYLSGKQLKPDFTGPVVIGVIGHISFPKGAKIVQDMLQIIDMEGVNARIVVIGSIEGVINSPSLRQTGHYEIDRLAHILEEEGVTVGFLPSIIPETFSYVTSELIQMNLPLAVFDLGAPADRVHGYVYGRVISQIDARSALRDIIELHHAIANEACLVQHRNDPIKELSRSY